LQSANGFAHIVTVHAPPEHPALAFGSAQTFLQPPQLLGSVAVSTSHPFAAAMSQSWKPVLQLAIVQTPAAQPLTAFGSMHALPQPPQLPGLVSVLVSQPLAALPSQLAKLGMHAPRPHVAFMHAGVAFAAGAHALPHEPQFAGSVAEVDSQPSAGVALQSS